MCKKEVFWVVTPCRVVGYLCFKCLCCFHLQGDVAARTSETLVSYNNTIRRHKPEYLALKHHRCESLKSRNKWTHVQYEILWPCGLAINEPQSCQLCHATCHLWSLQQLLNSMRVAAVHTIFGVDPKEIIAGIHVWWTWWPRTPRIRSVLEIDSTGHGYQRSCRTSKMAFTVCECAPSCWKNVSTWLPTVMTSICSCSTLYAILHNGRCYSAANSWHSCI